MTEILQFELFMKKNSAKCIYDKKSHLYTEYIP